MDSLPCPVQGLWLSDYSKDSTMHQRNQMCLCTLVCKLTHENIQAHLLSKHPALPVHISRNRISRTEEVPSLPVFSSCFLSQEQLQSQSRARIPPHHISVQEMCTCSTCSSTATHMDPKHPKIQLVLSTLAQQRTRKRSMIFFPPQNFILCLRKLPKKALSKPICF